MRAGYLEEQANASLKAIPTVNDVMSLALVDERTCMEESSTALHANLALGNDDVALRLGIARPSEPKQEVSMSHADPSTGNKAKLIKVASRSQVSLSAPALDTFLPDIVLDSVPELLRLGPSQFGLLQPSPSDVASHADVAVVIKAGAPSAHGLSPVLLAHDGSGKFKFMSYAESANKRGEAQRPPEIAIHLALMDRTYFQSLGNFDTLEWNQF